MTFGRDVEGVAPGAQIRSLMEDSPRWHIIAAEEAMDEGLLDVARAALLRAREAASPGSRDEEEADFASFRLAIASLDVKQASAELQQLALRLDAADPVWNLRVREIIETAPRLLSASLREGLLALLPPLPSQDAVSLGRVGLDEPISPALELPGDDDWDVPGSQDQVAPELPPIPTVNPFADAVETRQVATAEAAGAPGERLPGADHAPRLDAAAAAIATGDGRTVPGEAPQVERDPPPDPPAESAPSAGAGDPSPVSDDVVFLVDATLGESPVAPGFDGRVLVGSEIDARDADALRERLVEELLGRAGDDQGQLLFDAASTFLNNAEFATSELLFSAAMQVPELRVAACEGLMQSFIGGSRFPDALATAARATRIFAREGDALLGIVYLQGVAAQALGELAVARACYARVAATVHAAHFPELEERQQAVQ